MRNQLKEKDMSYQSTTVAEILDRTISLEEMTHGAETRSHLAMFATEVAKAMPHVKFARSGGHGREIHRLHVYMPNQEYTLGQIGRGDFSINGCTTTYMVFSRNIKNGKIQSWRDQHNMVLSEDLKRAVKNALRYLTPMSCYEIARESYDEFRGGLSSAIARVKDDFENLSRACMVRRTFEAEFRNLLAQNVTFITPEFQGAAAQFITASTDAQVASMRKVGALFVRIRNMGIADGGMAEIITFRQNLIDMYTMPSMGGNAPVLMEMSALSDELQAKLATLSMMPLNTYAEGLGVKAADNLYWVECDLNAPQRPPHAE
jgi:hypothetical protein